MLEIVAKRDSLIALLEEERQRWYKTWCSARIIVTYVNACYIYNFITFSHNFEYLFYIFILLSTLFLCILRDRM